MLHTIDTETLPCFPGNDNLHAITAQKKYCIRLEFTENMVEEYNYFAVADEGNKYRLKLGAAMHTCGKYNACFVL